MAAAATEEASRGAWARLDDMVKDRTRAWFWDLKVQRAGARYTSPAEWYQSLDPEKRDMLVAIAYQAEYSGTDTTTAMKQVLKGTDFDGLQTHTRETESRQEHREMQRQQEEQDRLYAQRLYQQELEERRGPIQPHQHMPLFTEPGSMTRGELPEPNITDYFAVPRHIQLEQESLNAHFQRLQAQQEMLNAHFQRLQERQDRLLAQRLSRQEEQERRYAQRQQEQQERLNAQRLRQQEQQERRYAQRQQEQQERRGLVRPIQPLLPRPETSTTVHSSRSDAYNFAAAPLDTSSSSGFTRRATHQPFANQRSTTVEQACPFPSSSFSVTVTAHTSQQPPAAAAAPPTGTPQSSVRERPRNVQMDRRYGREELAPTGSRVSANTRAPPRNAAGNAFESRPRNRVAMWQWGDVDIDRMGYEERLERFQDVKVGMKSWQIRELPIVRYHKTEGNKNVMCTICQCDFEEGERVMQLRCQHQYHPDCITQWFKEHKTCPICRACQCD